MVKLWLPILSIMALALSASEVIISTVGITISKIPNSTSATDASPCFPANSLAKY